jgi:hypothetical protein
MVPRLLLELSPANSHDRCRYAFGCERRTRPCCRARVRRFRHTQGSSHRAGRCVPYHASVSSITWRKARKIPTNRDGDHSPDDRYALLKGMRGRFSKLEAHMRTHASFAIAALIICSVTILWTKDNTDADVVRPRLTFAVVHLKPALQVNPVY